VARSKDAEGRFFLIGSSTSSGDVDSTASFYSARFETESNAPGELLEHETNQQLLVRTHSPNPPQALHSSQRVLLGSSIHFQSNSITSLSTFCTAYTIAAKEEVTVAAANKFVHDSKTIGASIQFWFRCV
jgi:hypothetical protein